MKLLYTTILLLITQTLIAQTDYLNLPFTSGTPYKTYNGNAAVIAAFGSLVIENFRFENFTNNQNGHALYLQNCTGVTVRNCYFSGTSITNPDVSGNRGLVMQFGGGNTIVDNFFNNCRGGILYLSTTTGNAYIARNEFLNITGPYSAGQFIAFNFNTGANNIIEDNRGANYYGESYPEDMISLFGTSGTSGSPTLVQDNYFIGTGPSASGGGIVSGESGGGSYVTLQRNKLLEPGNYGVGLVVTSDHGQLLNNYIYQPMKPWSNNGILCYDSPTNANVQGNKAYVIFGHNPGCPGCTPGASNPQYYNDYTVVSGGAVNNPTLYGTTQAQAATALAAFMADGFPVPLLTFITEDEIYQLRASKLYMEHIITFAASQDGLTRRRIERPTANAPADQSISTSTTTLVGTGTPLPAGENVISDYLWTFVNGPATPVIVSSTSATTNITGMTVSGTYRFRFQVRQENYLNLYPTEDVFTAHFDWVEVTVSGVAQTKYYISNSGSDAGAGTLAAPWLTIAKVNSSTFNAGDSIFFDKGDVWREQLTIPSSGAVNNRIVFTAYGSGAKPIINGADIKTGWVDGYNNINANIWGTASTNAVTTRAMVVINGTIYAEVSAITGLTTPNTYFIKTASTPDSLYVYNTTDPDALTAEVSKREYCIVTAAGASSKRYIEIADLEVRYAGRAGIYFEGPGSGVGNALNGSSYVRRCFAYANRLFGVVNYDHYDSLVVEDSKATYNGNGFYSWQADEGTFRRDTTANQIHYEAISVFTDGGAIQGYQSDNWLAEYCYSDADYDAIHIDAGNIAVDATIRYNKVFNSRSGSPSTPGYGIGNTAAGSVINMYYNLAVNCASASQESSLVAHAGTINVYNNTFYHNTSTGTDGIVYFNHGTGYTFKNNLYVRDYVAGEFNFVVLNSPMSTNNYNNYYILNNVSGTLRNWYSGAAYTTMAAWRTATSQDANSITVDPLFVNVASDWSLQSGSPCRNAGVSVGLTQDINGNPIVGLPDIGAYELQTLRYKGRIF